MENQFCQSCGMDMLESKASYGTNADGSRSTDYCHYCYANGSFTADISMNEMIGHWVDYMVKADSNLSEADARKKMETFLLTLKRWVA